MGVRERDHRSWCASLEAVGGGRWMDGGGWPGTVAVGIQMGSGGL